MHSREMIAVWWTQLNSSYQNNADAAYQRLVALISSSFQDRRLAEMNEERREMLREMQLGSSCHKNAEDAY